MIDNGEKLREAFEKHETQTPDPAAVYARVQELSRSYQRRRWGAQAAGGAVLGAGLIAGVITLPGMLPGQPSNDAGNAGLQAGGPAAPAAPSPLPSLIRPKAPANTPSLSAADLKRDREREAFFKAGYDYDDAVQLAKLWKMETDDIGAVKVAAGKKLLAGKKLPIEAGSAPEAPTPPMPKEEKQVNAFFAAGYDYDDATELAKIWHKKTPYDAKVLGGKKLLAGETLPIQP